MPASSNKIRVRTPGGQEADINPAKWDKFLEKYPGSQKVEKKKEPTPSVKQPTGAVSERGLPPTQPISGSRVSPSDEIESDNPKVRVKFNTQSVNAPEKGFFESITTGISDWFNEKESNLQQEDIDFIVTELGNQAKTKIGYDINFFKGFDVNTDYANKFLTDNSKKITYKDGTPLSELDLEKLTPRWNEYLKNQVAMKPTKVTDITRNLYKEQLKTNNPDLYARTYSSEGKPEKGRQLKWEETSSYGKYFDKQVLNGLSEMEKNAIGSFLIENKGEAQKLNRFAFGTAPKDLQNDIIQKALQREAQVGAERYQIYKDKGDISKVEKLRQRELELSTISAKLSVLENQINQNDFGGKDLSPEQQKNLKNLKAQYQVYRTEYDNQKNDFDSLKKEVEPIFEQLKQLEQAVSQDTEFKNLKAKMDPLYKQLEELKILAEQGNNDAAVRFNQLIDYNKKNIADFNAMAEKQNAIVVQYKNLYEQNKEKVDLYNQRVQSLMALEAKVNTKGNELNTYINNISGPQTSKIQQYNNSIDKYNNLVRQSAPLRDEYKKLVSELGPDVIKDIYGSVQKITQYEDFAKRVAKEKNPSIREMMMSNTEIARVSGMSTLAPFGSELIKYLTQSLGGAVRVVGDLGETITLKPEDYYSFADYASDVIQYGFDGSGKYWTDEILPGLRKSDFNDPITGEFTYTPHSLVVGSFEQMGQIAGAAISTYFTMGLGAPMNAAVVAPMFFATYDNNKTLAKQLGFQGSQATSAAILFSQIEGISELIFPDIQFFKGSMKAEAMKMFIENFQKGGTKMAVSRFLTTVGKEVSEEYSVEIGKYLATMMTKFAGGKNNVYEIDPSQLLETTIFTTLAGGMPAAIQAKVTSSKTFNSSMMFEMAKDLESSITMIDQYNEYGKLDNTKAEILKRNLKVISAVQGQLPNDISHAKRVIISSIYAQKAELQEKLNDSNIAPEIKDSYEKAIKKLNDLIAVTMLAPDEEYTKRYNQEMEKEANDINAEVKKEYPDLSAPTIVAAAEAAPVTETDRIRIQILDEIFKDSTAQNKADALEQRMNNAEEISMTEINDVLDGLYKQVEMVMDNYFDNEAGKQYAQALLDKIDKIKSYEFATDKETAVVTERKAVQTARASLQETASVINLARAPRATATITSEDGTTGTYSIEVGPDGAVTFEQPNTEPIRIGNVNDVNKTASIVETVLNEQGLPQSVSFSITDENGRKHTITVEAGKKLKPQQLLDLAINIRANELGTVDPTDFDTAYQEVTKEVTTVKPAARKEGVTAKPQERAVQVETAGQVPVQPEAGTRQEMAEGKPQAEPQVTAQAGVEEEIADIERRRQEELNTIGKGSDGKFYSNDGKKVISGVSEEDVINKLNAKYDAELAALGATPAPTAQAEPQAPAQKVKVQVAPKTRTETVESIRDKAKRANLDKATENVLASFKEAGIDVRIIEDEAEYDSIVGTEGTNGIFDDQNGVIYINPSRMKLAQRGNRVLFHESTHPILNILYNTDRARYDRIMNGMMDAALIGSAWLDKSTMEGLPLWQDLQNFRQRYIDRGYSEEQADNELMTETIGRIINGEIALKDIPVGWRQDMVDILNKIAKLLGIKPIGAVTDAGKFRDFAASLKDAFEKGRDISTIVGAENVKEFRSPFVEEQLSIMGIDQAQFLEMTKQMATDVESMVVPGNITNGWIQTGTKGGEQVVKFTGEATLENIRQYAIDSYINRAYNLAQYDLSGIDVKGDFLNKLVGIDAKQKALFEKSFFNVARTEIQKIIDSSKLNKAEKDTKEDLDRKKRTKDALKQALKINDIGQLYDAIEAIGKDMDVISSSLITSLYQKRDFVYDETVKSKIDRWNDQKKRGVRDAAWVTRKISELVFSKRNNEAMANEADGIYENMKTKVKENLRFIYDLVNPAIRNLTKLWYDGANVIAQEFGSKYNLSLEQTAGIIASQSPQMPWFSNLHLAQTIMDIMMTKGNEVFTKQQYDYYVAAARGYAKQRAYIPTVKGLIGKRLNELSDYDAGIFIRSYYDLNMSRKAPKRLPSGVIVSYETGDSSFSSYDTIEKGVSIFRDGSVENISANLGEANKVRNFYNNIVDPTNINSVTIDTHAMAVSLIMPFGASDTEIKFDSGSYAFYSDSYNELARELNLGARELQSITWEAIRAFFPDNVKTAKFKGEIADIWNRYSKGIITIDQARNEILNKGQDANKTEWSDSIQDWMDGKTGTDYFRPIDRKGDVPGTASGRAGQGIGGGVPTVAGADIREGRDVLGRKPSVGRKTKGQPSLVEGQESLMGQAKPIRVFHAGTLKEKGNIYLTPRINEAKEYASMNNSDVFEFEINIKDIAPENFVRSAFDELGLKLPDGYDLNELLLHEVLDTRFDSSLSKKDIDKLYEYLKQKGYSGISFIDEDILQKRKEGVNNFIVFEKDYLKPIKPSVRGQMSLMGSRMDDATKTYRLTGGLTYADAIKSIKDNLMADEKMLVSEIEKEQVVEDIVNNIFIPSVQDKRISQKITNLQGLANAIYEGSLANWDEIKDEYISKNEYESAMAAIRLSKEIKDNPKMFSDELKAIAYGLKLPNYIEKQFKGEGPYDKGTTPVPQFSLMGERDVAKRLEGVDITVLENIEKPISESKFENKYVAQHKDLLGKREGNWDKNKENILKSGFKEGINVNALPIYTGYERNVIDQRYGNRKGDIIYILPKEGVTEGPNGYKTKEGYKPQLSDVFAIEYDKQPTYEAYRNNLKNPSYIASAYIQAKQDGSNPELVKAVEDAIGKPRGQASLMDDPAPIIEQFGRKAESFADAEQALSNGDYVFLSSEMDGIPYIANDIQSLKANYDEVVIVKKEDYPIPSAPKQQVDDINKKIKKSYPKGQASFIEPSILISPATTASIQYPLYQSMLQMGLDAYDNGARDIEMFTSYGKSIQWPTELTRNYHTEMVWGDVMRIKQNKKPYINSEADYRKMLERITKNEKYVNERINEKKNKSWRTAFSKKAFDSKRAFFKALLSQSGELWNVVAAYVHTMGGMTAKSVYEADQFMEATFNGLSETEEYDYNGMKWSERQLIDRIIILEGYLETVRKMEDKFDYFIALESAWVNETDPTRKASLKKNRDEVKDYLERNKVLAGDGKTVPYSLMDFKRSNLTPAKARDLLIKLQRAIPNDVYYNLNKRVDAYFEAFKILLEKKYNEGMISREAYEEMAEYKYVPTRFIGYLLNDLQQDQAISLSTGTRDQIQRLMGGSEEELLMQNQETLKFATFSLNRSIQRNRASLKLAEAVRANPNNTAFYFPGVSKRDKYGNATEWTYDSKNKGLIKYYVDGKVEAIATDIDVANAYNGVTEEFDMPEALSMVFMTTPFRMVTTNFNPGFGLAQIVIDLNQALLASDAYASIIYGAPAVLFRDIKLLSGKALGLASRKMGLPFNLDNEWNELYSEAREYGALISFTREESLDEAISKAAGKKSVYDRLVNGNNPFAKLANTIERVNTSMEYVTRLAVYRKKRNNLEDEYRKNNGGKNPTGTKLDDIRTEAAAAALNILNYNRGGTWVRSFNKAMAYLNVQFQVPYSIVQNFKKSPGLTSLKAAELAVYGALGMVALYNMLDDDDKKWWLRYYNGLSVFEKSNYWHFPNPFRDKDDPDTWLLRFKKPQFLLPLINSTEVFAMNYFTGGKTQGFTEYMKANPLDEYTPSFGRDLYEAQPLKLSMVSSVPSLNMAFIGFWNYDLYRMEEVVRDAENIANPLEGIDDPQVGQFYKYVSQNAFVDDSEYFSDGILSPKRMDRAIKAGIGDYSRNPITAYPLFVLGSVMNSFSEDYKKANERVPPQPEKSILSKLLEGAGLTQRFTTKIPELKGATRKAVQEQKIGKDAIYSALYFDMDKLIEKGEILTRDKVIQWFEDINLNKNKMFTVDEYDTLLENAIKYAKRNQSIRAVENQYLWLKRFILVPSSDERSTIWKSETKDYSKEEKIQVLKYMVENELYVLDSNPEFDEVLAEDIESSE